MRRGVRRKRSSPVDAHVGSRIRLRRVNLGMSQKQLGTALGLTFQQVQKYESGANRVNASKLYYLSQTLGVPVSFFFDSMPAPPGRKGTSRDAVGADLLASRESNELVRAYYAIPSPVRHALLKIMQSAAEPTPGSASSPRGSQ
jgi:transcriptional regulator with XRE-family HTH domain